jgi:hypothetical protein
MTSAKIKMEGPLRWVPLGVVCAIALVEALRAAAPPAPPHADAAARAAAAADLRSHEAQYRKEAAKDFPTDPWSQDDAFHQKEGKEARAYAKSHYMSLGEVLDAADADMRARAANGDSTIIATVPPCHPRAIY